MSEAPPRPTAAEITIVEKRSKPRNPDSFGAELIVPNEVRLNGLPLLVPAGQSVTVHEIGIDSSDVVQVTLTLYARRVVIEHDETEATNG